MEPVHTTINCTHKQKKPSKEQTTIPLSSSPVEQWWAAREGESWLEGRSVREGEEEGGREGGRPPPTYVRTGREEKRDERGGITPGKLHNTGLLNQDLNP